MTAKPLNQQTPAEIDTQLADLYYAEAKAENDILAAVTKAHNAIGERQRTINGKKSWPTSDADAIAKAREIGDPDAYYFTDEGSAYKAVSKFDTATAELARIHGEQKVFYAEFDRRGGWSRFFTVQQHNGHIHSGMRCSTCNKNGASTQFGWNADLSGLTEAEAVAKLGPSLCTVCFPTAPVEWTLGKQPQTAEQAAADGKCINRIPTNLRRQGMSFIGDCGACGARAIAATSGGLRKHTHAKQAQDAERKARIEDPKLIGTPEGDVLKVDRETLKTVRTAEIKYIDELWWAAYGDKYGMASESLSEHRANAAVILEALAAKAGVTVEVAAEKLAARLAKKLRDL